MSKNNKSLISHFLGMNNTLKTANNIKNMQIEDIVSEIRTKSREMINLCNLFDKLDYENEFGGIYEEVDIQ